MLRLAGSRPALAGCRPTGFRRRKVMRMLVFADWSYLIVWARIGEAHDCSAEDDEDDRGTHDGYFS